ncbi:hypothetical protein ACOSQ2_021180 [Xanthoceras sorbifolium]
MGVVVLSFSLWLYNFIPKSFLSPKVIIPNWWGGWLDGSEGTSSFVRKVLSQPRRWCRDFLTEFQEAGSASVRQLLGVALRNHSWRPLDANMFKINYDVVVCLTGSIVGIGVVIKDSSEAMMLSASKTIEADYSPSLVIEDILDLKLCYEEAPPGIRSLV